MLLCRSKRLTVMTAACALVLVGCEDDSSGPLACTADFRYGLNIEVVEAGTAIVIENAEGTATDGEYRERLMAIEPGTLVGAGERPGTYDVTVTAPGYEPWTVTNLELGFDGCHVVPAVLTAALDPTG